MDTSFVSSVVFHGVIVMTAGSIRHPLFDVYGITVKVLGYAASSDSMFYKTNKNDL